jgi:hypothetical protein
MILNACLLVGLFDTTATSNSARVRAMLAFFLLVSFLPFQPHFGSFSMPYCSIAPCFRDW